MKIAKTLVGIFAGGDVIRPHLLTTAIGHGSIAADGIHNYLLGRDLEKPDPEASPRVPLRGGTRTSSPAFTG